LLIWEDTSLGPHQKKHGKIFQVFCNIFFLLVTWEIFRRIHFCFISYMILFVVLDPELLAEVIYEIKQKWILINLSRVTSKKMLQGS
jgi:hypothetical protein